MLSNFVSSASKKITNKVKNIRVWESIKSKQQHHNEFLKIRTNKKPKEPKNARRETDLNYDTFAEVLACSENAFTLTLDRLAL